MKISHVLVGIAGAGMLAVGSYAVGSSTTAIEAESAEMGVTTSSPASASPAAPVNPPGQAAGLQVRPVAGSGPVVGSNPYGAPVVGLGGSVGPVGGGTPQLTVQRNWQFIRDWTAPALVQPTVSQTASDEVATLTLSMDELVLHPNDMQATLMIELTGNANAVNGRAPVNLSVVIDTSGSMRGDKLDAAVAATTEWIERLQPGDRLTVVAFSDRAEAVIADAVITDDTSVLRERVSELRARGNTCIACGMEMALQTASDLPTHQARMIVMSDGIDNESQQPPESIAAQFLAERTATTATIGFGSDADTALMTRVAEHGAGPYYYMHHESVFGAILAQELQTLSRTVASNVALTIQMSGGANVSSRVDIAGLSRRERSVVIPVGQLAGGETRTYMVPIDLPPSGHGRVVDVQATFADMSVQPHRLDAGVAVSRSADPQAIAMSRDGRVLIEMQRMTAIADVTELLDAYDAGATQQSVTGLRNTALLLREEAVASGSESLQAEAELIGRMADDLSADYDNAAAAPSVVSSNRSRMNEARRGSSTTEGTLADSQDFALAR